MTGAHETQELTPLEAAPQLSPREVGPKARNLGVLRRAGLPVPPGFVLPASAWEAFGRGAGIQRRLREGASAAELRELCLSAPFPRAWREAVEAALSALLWPLAVRSAATLEDGAAASAAGLFHTSLDVSSVEQAMGAIRQCWASQFADAAVAYQAAQEADEPEDDGGMAVLIQAMVRPRAAGVLFTRVTDGRGALIEAVPGSGRLLVDGTVNPVRYRIPLDGAPIESAEPVTDRLLSPAALDDLRRFALRAEELLETSTGVDIEWAWNDEGVHLLQARPITRPVTITSERIRWIAANTQEALLDPVTPLTWSLLAPLVEAGRRDLFRAAGFEEIDGPGYMRLFQGLPYFNPDYFRRFLRQIPGAPENIFDALIFGEGDRSPEFSLPEFNARTLRLIGLFALARVAARERFEVYQRVFGVRLALLSRRRLDRLDDGELLALRRDATDLLEGALRRHVLGTAISGGAYLLLELALEATGAEEAFGSGLAARLTAGSSGNALARASAELERLARKMAASDAAGSLQQLSLGEGPFVRPFRRFLSRFGHRCEKEAEVSEPRWADDPQVLLSVLSSYVQAASGEQGLAHLEDREAELAGRAQELAGRVTRFLARRSLLERVVPIRRLAFRALLREARRYAPYRENLKDRALRALHLVRRVFLEVGARLVRRGLLDVSGDVFFLEVDEVERALTATALEDADRQGLRAKVRARRAERARDLQQAAPGTVIELPGRPPQPIHTGQLGARAVLEGVGVSSGKLSGVARVLGSMDDAGRLAPGEILVARVINAGWTPLFHLAGAIVAEVGGVLSHGAIVAREYGIPAVFGAAGASQIPDGARITVDGDLGIVTVAE